MSAFNVLAAATIALAAATPGTARTRAEASIVITAPLETVWALVTDINRWPQWNTAVQAYPA